MWIFIFAQSKRLESHDIWQGFQVRVERHTEPHASHGAEPEDSSPLHSGVHGQRPHQLRSGSASCLARGNTRHTPLATCHMLLAIWHMPHAACRMMHATYRNKLRGDGILHVTHHRCLFHVTHSTCHMLHITCNGHMSHGHATCNMLHVACRKPHVACQIYQRRVWFVKLFEINIDCTQISYKCKH